MITELGKKLKHRLALPLPGLDAQLKMAPPERRLIHKLKTPAHAKWGSVLLLLFEEEGKIRFPLIVRADYDGVHSGQIAFPGGKFEAGDLTMENTALRECGEEIGIIPADVEIIGRLTELYIPPSNFLVYPHIGIIRYLPTFFPDATEVTGILTPDLDVLMDEKNIREEAIHLQNGLTIQAPAFIFSDQIVWGATAMILSEFRSILFETEI